MEITYSFKQPYMVKPFRQSIINLEQEVGQLAQIEMPLRHFFLDRPADINAENAKTYVRELTIPAGVALVGKMHKYPCINIISKGRITVATEDGVKEITAPCTMVSPAGVKRAGYAHEETVWTTIHLTDETDVDKLVDRMTVESYEQYEQFLLEEL